MRYQKVFIARVGIKRGRHAEHVQELVDGIRALQSAGERLFVTYAFGILAETLAALGRTNEALTAIDEGLVVTDETQQHWSEPELHRIKGEILRTEGSPDAVAGAEQSFRRSLGISARQRAKWWELRASVGLARLWRDQGRCDDARTLLAGIHDWFSEGLDTADMHDARTLLEELS